MERKPYQVLVVVQKRLRGKQTVAAAPAPAPAPAPCDAMWDLIKDLAVEANEAREAAAAANRALDRQAETDAMVNGGCARGMACVSIKG